MDKLIGSLLRGHFHPAPNGSSLISFLSSWALGFVLAFPLVPLIAADNTTNAMSKITNTVRAKTKITVFDSAK
jgi:hypothetical protein